MRRQNLALWCCTLLFVASYSKSWGNSTTTSDDVKSMRYNLHKNSTKNDEQYEFRANSNDNYEDNDLVQYAFHAQRSVKNHQEGDQILMELRANSTKADDENNFTLYNGNLTQVEDTSNLTSYELSEKFYQDEKNIIPYQMCENITCIPLCCPLGKHLQITQINDTITEECVDGQVGQSNYLFPDVYEYVMNDSKRIPIGKKLDQIFPLTIHDPCQYQRYVLEPEIKRNEDYLFLSNGSLYQLDIKSVVTSYCLAIWEDDKKFDVTICFDREAEDVPPEEKTSLVISLIVSLPFLLVTFVVYSILPELWNMHGYTLRGYVGSLFVAYMFLVMINLIHQAVISYFACIAFAFIIHFSFLASFFWLNVMCFDIWWTFGGFRSLQGSVKQRERKKFIIYSIYAWGSASLLSIICAIMDFVPSVPKELIRPEFGVSKCWFNTDEARALYFYGPMGVTVICNICLFISTALKIVRHKKDTAHHLRGSESRRHDDNKQWFNLYLKLFIVMGINWSMEIISWLFKSAPPYVWYISDLTNTLQGLIIFIIFVWKKKIKRLLLKRFGCQDRDFFSRNSTRSGNHSSASRTCTTTSGLMSLQEKVNPYVQTNCRAKSSSDEVDS
ncbi:G-protein coupled receptor Mth2 [Trachymyrmex septentrionalis]|uniref:G-protein coupled receptor Mth2 n=1 Tax=Trachymyrmex septentrionalis TaxID=34720 RepID=A0A195FEV0_9HYME|nr:G-protein coupled receptor Mth2 [Trachymyrmex septentrionalis]